MSWAYRIAVVALIALISVTINLPASLLRRAVDSDTVQLIATTGTMWQGSAEVVALGVTSHLKWQTTATPLGATFVLTHQNSKIGGHLSLGTIQHEIDISGRIGSSTLAPLLSQYDLFVPGTFELPDTKLLWDTNGPRLRQPSALQWSGGLTQYILANRRYEARMPPLVAILNTTTGGALEAKVKTSQSETEPLLTLRMKTNNDIYLGVTRGLLRLANYPWSGAEADTALIFEVERALTKTTP